MPFGETADKFDDSDLGVVAFTFVEFIQQNNPPRSLRCEIWDSELFRNEACSSPTTWDRRPFSVSGIRDRAV